jgi:hypothetical protein
VAVLDGHLFDQLGECLVDGRTAGSVWVGPLRGDQAPVPAQDHGWGDQPVQPQPCGQQTHQPEEDQVEQMPALKAGYERQPYAR